MSHINRREFIKAIAAASSASVLAIPQSAHAKGKASVVVGVTDDLPRRKARRTFSTQLWLMDNYKDFIFNQSSAQAYKWIEEDDPELFARIQQAVADGRWEPVGGMWVEPDSQVTGGEAYVRQLFYGQRYFDEKGVKKQGS